MTDDQSEFHRRRAARTSCKRFLSGDRLPTIRERLTRLAANC
ncbi:hypothetical protein [Kitasatospora sp. NPDC085464]